MIKKYNFKIEEILEMISLYQLGVPTSTIAKLFDVSNVTLWKALKEYEKKDLMKFRTRSETILKTLSKKRTSPKGERINRAGLWKKEFGKKGLIDILAIFLVTDASADYKYKIIRLASSDKIFLKIFTDLLNELNLEPRKTKDRRNNLNIIFSRNNKVKIILDEVYKRTKTTKHQPQRGKENWKGFLKEQQPSISFLYETPKNLIELCFRIGISLEGCVLASKQKNRLTRPELRFTCFNPNLLGEWQKVSKLLDINMRLEKNRLRTRSLINIRKFLEIGGFIEGVKNSSKSRYSEGIEKNKILKDLFKEYYLNRSRKDGKK